MSKKALRFFSIVSLSLPLSFFVVSCINKKEDKSKFRIDSFDSKEIKKTNNTKEEAKIVSDRQTFYLKLENQRKYDEDYMFSRINIVSKKTEKLDEFLVFNFYKNDKLDEIKKIINSIDDIYIPKQEKEEFINFIYNDDVKYIKSKLIAINSYFLWQLKK